VLFTKYYYCDKINVDEMGGACSARGTYTFWSENINGRKYLVDQVINGRIILRCFLKNSVLGCELDSTGSGQSSVLN
jgi:hypothetical protein